MTGQGELNSNLLNKLNKPLKLRLEFDLVSHPARDGGFR